MNEVVVKALREMESHLDDIRQSPADEGPVTLIVSRPQANERMIIKRCALDIEKGMVGDNWITRGDKHTVDGLSDPRRQITIMNTRAIRAITDAEACWPEAGDQFYVDFDLSDVNIPPGTRLAIGEAEVEVTELPHLGCAKFGTRFGRDANMFVNSDLGKSLNLRGINARVVKAGTVNTGDVIRKLETGASIC